MTNYILEQAVIAGQKQEAYKKEIYCQQSKKR